MALRNKTPARCSILVGIPLTSGFSRKRRPVISKPRRGPPNTHGEKITHWSRFRAFVKEHHDKTQAEMAELWDGPISARTISRALAKIGFTRKKNYGYRQRNEAHRERFRPLLGDPKAPHLTYVDESGMDERDDYG